MNTDKDPTLEIPPPSSFDGKQRGEACNSCVFKAGTKKTQSFHNKVLKPASTMSTSRATRGGGGGGGYVGDRMRPQLVRDIFGHG